jgi:hypothetical protein
MMAEELQLADRMSSSLLEGVRQEAERVERLEQAIREAVPEWSLAEVVTALRADARDRSRCSRGSAG